MAVDQQADVLAAHPALLDRRLAYALKEICQATWTHDPNQTIAAAHALQLLATLTNDDEIAAYADWAQGIAAITQGSMEEALAALDRASHQFEQLAQAYMAAATSVSKLIALGMLGRYDEAMRVGIHARDIFLAHHDTLAAGKIEQNLGVMAWRRDRYQEAEQFHRAARERFARAGNTDLLVAAENALAADLTSQYRLQEAISHYTHALDLAQAANLPLRQAEIECNLGNLALAQGQYHEALEYLEQSRRRYAALGMPHELAYADQELAEAYLSLNMATEAAAISARVIPMFAELGMQSEQAWALAHHGQAAVLLQRYDDASQHFREAHQLFLEEENHVSAAVVALFEAQLATQRGDYERVDSLTQAIEPIFAEAGNQGRVLLARWVRSESLRRNQQTAEARQLLESILPEAERYQLLPLVQRCLVALGQIALADRAIPTAEAYLIRAITIIEGLRDPLPSEEFRTAFIADKLSPYTMLMQMCLDRSPADIAMALGYDERARARALVDVIGSTLQRHTTPQADAVDQQQLNELHQDLHWLHQQLTERLMSEGAATPAFAALQQAVQDREARILELNRQHQIRSASMIDPSSPFDLAALQQQLGTTTVLVSYAILGDELIAFVVTDDRVEVVRQLATEPQIEDSVNRLRFQIDALRSNRQPNGPHAQQLLNRTQHHLRTLYRILIAPLEPLLGTRRLVVIPHGILHYLPFQALYTGDHYLIEQREICTAPSASVLQLCLDRPSQPHPQALLCGVPDTYAPHVRDEIAALADHFQQPVVLLDQQATSLALRQHAPTASIIHLACHATFRPDNPLFSALHLADGRFTTRDAYTLDLQCDLVVLSACETGVSHVAAGNEILGLARGFFAAGTPALIVSLWMVDDASTTQLMIQFYQRMQAGDSPAQALRTAQCQLLQQFPHPFFWAPFMLMGRW